MEGLWFIPLYLIVPAIAIIILTFGFSNRSKILKIIGFAFLLIPIAHAIVTYINQYSEEKDLEEYIIGNYIDPKSNMVLEIRQDKSFLLSNYQTMEVDGNYYIHNPIKGKWRLVNIDIFNLVFESETENINLTINLMDSQHNLKIKSIGNYNKVVNFIEQN